MDELPTSPLLMPLTCSSTAGPIESSAFFTCRTASCVTACLCNGEASLGASQHTHLLETSCRPEPVLLQWLAAQLLVLCTGPRNTWLLSGSMVILDEQSGCASARSDLTVVPRSCSRRGTTGVSLNLSSGPSFGLPCMSIDDVFACCASMSKHVHATQASLTALSAARGHSPDGLLAALWHHCLSGTSVLGWQHECVCRL